MNECEIFNYLSKMSVNVPSSIKDESQFSGERYLNELNNIHEDASSRYVVELLTRFFFSKLFISKFYFILKTGVAVTRACFCLLLRVE